MRHQKKVLATVFFTAAVFLGPTGDSTLEAGYRYGYRGYRYRPFYGARFHYRPYFRPYYRTWYRPYYYRPTIGFYSQPYAYYRPRVTVQVAYGGGQVGYNYNNGAIQTKVEPKQTQIFVDGYYAGVADDFNGTFQKLYLPPGEHDIELRLDGYRSFSQRLFINSGTNVKVRHEMETLGRAERVRPDSAPVQSPPPSERDEEYRSSEATPPTPPTPTPPPSEGNPKPTERQSSASSSRFGLLTLRVQPSEAEVVIDSQVWGSLEGLEQITIHLPTGRHKIEIRSQGYRPFETEVDIGSGEATPLNVRLALQI